MRQLTTAFSTRNLDRQSEFRRNEAWLAESLGSHGSLFHVVVNGQVATTGSVAAGIGFAAAKKLAGDGPFILLGNIEGTPHFAFDGSKLELPKIDTVLQEVHDGDAILMGLRDAAPVLGADDANLLAFAVGICNWHKNHQFCGRCAAPTEIRSAGHERHCNNCGYDCFPRTDPAMIALIHNKANDACLLGRQDIWPERMYSTLAGFLEPGESLEDTVRREVKEEAGITVGAVRYVASQPWPFPQSVMVGFIGEAETEEIVVQTSELADAKWFTREQVEASIALGRRGDPMIPQKLTIARSLIDAWLSYGLESKPSGIVPERAGG